MLVKGTDCLLSFILPTFNECENITTLIEELEILISKEGYRSEIIVIDDDSPNGTGDTVKELQGKYSNIRLRTRKNERGIGSAHACGYDLAEGEVIITMDADGSHDVSDVPRLLAKLDDGFDVVIGSRYQRGGGSDKPLFNRLVSRFGGHYSRVMLRLGVVDSTNGFRVFRRPIWERIRRHRFSARNSFLIEFLYYAKREKALLCEVPVFFHERERGESKTPVFREGLKAIVLPLRLFFTRQGA